ncbi:phosphatase PAP2 family protein [Gilvibacter sediminis]|uniref:phosphatase PAP2 family protein n=1 Tax=Gilvibacter sediminis TaxID=379071 RepID=UPI00234FF08A|nr:phosphatase PAP2 family protein [Gilvibacter sediminis]MDC7999302.1 phosphatase PAP2 family protein [Gilvibacter sediminis]
MIDQLLQYDSELFIYLNSLGSTTWDNLWLVITNKFASIPIYAILLYLVYKNFGWKFTAVVVVTTALMITFTDQLTNLAKDFFERPRPCQEASLEGIIRYVAPRCGKFSFFSGHATSTMAGAVFISLILRSRYKYLPFLMLFWAFLVSYSRVYVGVHYPLDIFTGMIVGALAGLSFYKLERYLQRRFATSV